VFNIGRWDIVGRGFELRVIFVKSDKQTIRSLITLARLYFLPPRGGARNSLELSSSNWRHGARSDGLPTIERRMPVKQTQQEALEDCGMCLMIAPEGDEKLKAGDTGV